MDSNKTILKIKDLQIKNRDGRTLVDHFCLELKRGETLGLVGESGSGKTLSLRSILGLLPDGISQTYESREILGECSMIFQNPLSALDPLCPVFKQLQEVVQIRQKKGKKEAAAIAAELWRHLSLPEDAIGADRYPSQLSGGQCQRILIAMALACHPDILLCDEPTTALDVTVQKQTLELIRQLQKELSFAVIFVTHNLAVAAELCEKLCVMQNGKIVETGDTKKILTAPEEPYTKMLVGSILSVPKQRKEAEDGYRS
jgi:ABC-type glutathione transport system ATPase component